MCQRFAATALVAALDHRRRTGEGQHIDLSQFEAAVQLLGPQLLEVELTGRAATRDGNRSPWACPHGVYPTRPVRGHEGWVAIAVETDDQWRALRRAMGEPDWACRPGYDTLLGRKADEDELDLLVGEWTAAFEQADLVAALQPAVPAGAVHDQTGLRLDPQVEHRGYFVTLDHRDRPGPLRRAPGPAVANAGSAAQAGAVRRGGQHHCPHRDPGHGRRPDQRSARRRSGRDHRRVSGSRRHPAPHDDR